MSGPPPGAAAARSPTPRCEANVLRATDASLAHRARGGGRAAGLGGAPPARGARSATTRSPPSRPRSSGSPARRRARGAEVHLARTPRTPRRIVIDIARAPRAPRILKAKSMTSEEVGLNRGARGGGLSAPRDRPRGVHRPAGGGAPVPHHRPGPPPLGRAGPGPLRRRTGSSRGAAPRRRTAATSRAWLSLAAREHLRAAPRSRPTSGSPARTSLVAETGTLVHPRERGQHPVHHDVAAGAGGARWESTRSSPASRTSRPSSRSSPAPPPASAPPTYVSLISGPIGDGPPRRAARRRPLADPRRPADREILRCIRCGACLNVCPVYRTVGGHAYGSPYPGPDRRGAHPAPARPREDDRLLPGALVPLRGLHRDLPGRHRPPRPPALASAPGAVRAGHRSRLERLAFRALRLRHVGERRYRLAAGVLAPASRLADRLGLLAAWTTTRALPPLRPPPLPRPLERSMHRLAP